MKGTLLTGKSPEEVVRDALAVFDNEPPAGTPSLWRGAALEFLADQYGPARVTEVLATARRFVNGDPWTARALLRSGFGSHPVVVLALVEAALERSPP